VRPLTTNPVGPMGPCLARNLYYLSDAVAGRASWSTTAGRSSGGADHADTISNAHNVVHADRHHGELQHALSHPLTSAWCCRPFGAQSLVDCLLAAISL
jgi:hypothetical protein